MARITARNVFRGLERLPRQTYKGLQRLRSVATRERRAASRISGREQSVYQDGHWFAFEISPDATRSLSPQLNYREVATVLNGAGIRFAVTSKNEFQPYDVAVHSDDWARTVDAISSSLADRAAYGRVRESGQWRAPMQVGSSAFRERALVAAEFKIHILTRRSAKTRLNGAALACSVRAWTPNANNDALAAPGANATATQVPLDAFDTIVEGAAIDREPEPRFADATPTDDLSVQFPIDLVYLWVDGSDPEWVRQRAEVEASAQDEVHEYSTGQWLYRDRNELMYSMRSVEEFAPWVRKIHLFTAGQVPRWLDTSNPKIELHSHSDVFDDPEALPTYNSHAIGSRIHHIPGLSDRYLVMNDDVMFGAPVLPEDFFTAGGVARVRFSRRHAAIVPLDLASPIERARRKTAGIVEELHGIRPSRLFAHAPIPQIKGSQFELEEKFAAEFEATRRSRFRNPDDIVIVSWLGLYHLLYSGRAVASEISYQYFYCTTPKLRAALIRAFASRDVQVICVNDGVESGVVDTTDWLSGALNSAFPVRSAFELPRALWRDSVYLP